MKQIFSKSIVFALALLLLACSSTGAKKHATVDAFAPKRLTVSGHGVPPRDASLTKMQAQLLAEQAARLNAFRALASLLYREQLNEGATAGGQVLRDERYRIYFDLYLREAETISVRNVGNTVQTDLSLTVTDRFYRCMSGQLDVVQQCLRQDNKMPFTRLGYRSAEKKTVNLACSADGCADMLHVQGFADRKNAFDRGLLNAGLYDGEWSVNTAARLLINFILLNNIPNL